MGGEGSGAYFEFRPIGEAFTRGVGAGGANIRIYTVIYNHEIFGIVI